MFAFGLLSASFIAPVLPARAQSGCLLRLELSIPMSEGLSDCVPGLVCEGVRPCCRFRRRVPSFTVNFAP